MKSDIIKGDYDKYLRDVALKVYENNGESEIDISFKYSPSKLVMVISDPKHSSELLSEYVKILNQMKFENMVSYFTIAYDTRYLTVNLTK